MFVNLYSIHFQMLTKNHLKIGNWQRYLNILRRYASSDSIQKYDEYNFFKQSILATDHFQYSLPRLPIPSLNKTCERYLTAVTPILNDDRNILEETRRIVDDFCTGDGKRLDAQLRHKNRLNRHTSYISQPWFEMYLKARVPLVLNHNFFLALTDDENTLQPAARITNYIISSVRFMKTLRANWLDPEVFHLNPKRTNTDRFRKSLRFVPKRISFFAAMIQKAYPLDMSQYTRLFNSTRIPKPNCDILETNMENIRHIIVIKRGHYYKVNILDKNEQLLSAEKIAAMMKYLSENLNEEENKYPFGYFTADRRDRWATIRANIEALSERNKQIFKEIDNSIMVVCLGKIIFSCQKFKIIDLRQFLFLLSV